MPKRGQYESMARNCEAEGNDILYDNWEGRVGECSGRHYHPV